MIACVVLLLSACAREDTGGEIKNVLVIVVDTLRADHLGSYGYDRATSPNIDRWAAESVQFDRAFSVSPCTCVIAPLTSN